MSIRPWVGLAVLVLPCACDEEKISDPIGDAWVQTVGGLCEGPCPHVTVYRDGADVQFHRDNGQGAVTYESFGTLTEAGLTEFQAASAEVAAALPQDFHVCTPVDGIDVVVTLDDGEMQWEESYCDLGTPEEPLQRVDTFLDGLREALDDCTSNEHVAVSGC
jgi:hypothetical protein